MRTPCVTGAVVAGDARNVAASLAAARYRLTQCFDGTAGLEEGSRLSEVGTRRAGLIECYMGVSRLPNATVALETIHVGAVRLASAVLWTLSVARTCQRGRCGAQAAPTNLWEYDASVCMTIC